MEHCLILRGNPYRLYQLVLTDTTIVSFHPNDEENNTSFYLYMFNENDSLIYSNNIYSATMTMPPAKYLIQYGAHMYDLGEHTISLTKTPPMPHKAGSDSKALTAVVSSHDSVQEVPVV